MSKYSWVGWHYAVAIAVIVVYGIYQWLVG